jgi:predicted dithiol-disulfide oxidoreductase (DUF899 family)
MQQRPYPNETPEYRKARNALLEEERALREHVERVAALRRTLPLGGTVASDYVFEERGKDGRVSSVKLSELFAPGKQSLMIYSFMFGPKMDHACPMCTSFLDSLNGAAPHLGQRMSLAVSARSSIERVADYGASRGWSNLRLLSSAKNSYQHDYLAEGDDGGQWPMANIFVQRDGEIRHFWGSELFFHPYPSKDTRHVDQLRPLWNVLDLTPEGRGETWYPALSYPASETDGAGGARSARAASPQPR